jgi:hypothetical protein
MRKSFKLAALKEERKKLGFVLPVEGRSQNNFRAARALPRSRRGFGRKLGAIIR